MQLTFVNSMFVFLKFKVLLLSCDTKHLFQQVLSEKGSLAAKTNILSYIWIKQLQFSIF